MSAASNPAYLYQLGGSLSVDHPSYVMRQADRDFYTGLKAGNLCYVLNSRQTGKSSLRIRTMNRLQADGVCCAEIDLSGIGSHQIAPEQWYGGIIQEIISSLELKINRRNWWRDRDDLSPVMRFKEFIETVLLLEGSQNIVIFIDEIDSVLKLNFKDDFFAVVRSCYNKRAEKSAYGRLTFALLGVATPSDLIQDKSRTPFNIGQAIELQGFQLHEAQPLTKGLVGKTSNPQKVLKAILTWTEGQPFLTQKLCNFIQSSPSFIPSGLEEKWVDDLVKAQVIDRWESQDEPEHLRTISDRILNNGQRTGRLLGMYQRILQQDTISTDNSPEQSELRLSGLVVKHQGTLKISNPIYSAVFTPKWVNQVLEDLRPYAEGLAAWSTTQRKDESRLLRGQALLNALIWAEDKSLSDLDYQFLSASQELDKREIQIALDTEKEASYILSEANDTLVESQQKARQTIRRGVTGLVMISVVAFTVLGWVGLRVRQAETQRKWAEIAELNARAAALFLSNDRLGALVNSVKAGRQLLDTDAPTDIKSETAKKLKQILDEVQEYNRLENHSASVYSVKFSPDGQTIASASGDNTVKLWSRDGQELIALKGHSNPVYDVDFSPDNQTIASASGDKTIKLWSRDGKEIKTLRGHSARVLSVKFSPDGQTLASGSDDRTIKLWSREGKEIKTLIGHGNGVFNVNFSPDGKVLASASSDQTIKLWNRDGKELKTLRGHNGTVYSVNFSPDAQTIISASADRSIKLWNQAGRAFKTFQGQNAEVYSASFSPDGQTFASANGNTVKLWSRDGSEIGILKGHHDAIRSVSFSPNNQALATASMDNTIKLWSNKRMLLKTFNGHSRRIYSVDFSPDGQTLASGSDDRTIKFWNRDGRALKTLTGHSAAVSSIDFSPDGQLIASASDDKTIRLWSREGKALKTLKGHNGMVYSVIFSPDNRLIASASGDKTIKLWSREGKALKTLKGHSDGVNSLSFSPDSQLIASASDDKTIRLWSREGQEIKTLTGHSDGVYSVSFSPDGQILASAGGDKIIKLWNRDGTLLRTLNGHDAAIYNVSFSPNSQLLASASADKTIKLWNRDGTLLRTLNGHTSPVNGVSFSPDARILASASSDKTLKLWQLDDLANHESYPSELMLGCNWLKDYLKTNIRFHGNERLICN
jgi:WD40 repeat protein